MASNGGTGFPAWKWRYLDRLLASYGHPADKAARKWLRELRDRAVDHENALLEIADTEWGDVSHEVNGPSERAEAALGL